MASNKKNESDSIQNVDVSMITLSQANIRKKSSIDINKTDLTDKEKMIIRKEVEIIKEKYPNYIPIIVRPKDNTIKLIKHKFLVGGDVTIGQFLSILRKKMKNLKPAEAIYLFINNKIPASSELLSSIYQSNLDETTQMLYMTICKENTFG